MKRHVDPKTLATELNRIETLERPDLLGLWLELHGRRAPKSLSLAFLRRVVTYEVQCRTLGGLKRKTKVKLLSMAEAMAQIKEAGDQSALPTIMPAQKLVPGARLFRDWNGKTWVVDITETGFVMQGQSYRSLTAIAKQITGAHWSGPRFFGLNNKTSKDHLQPVAASSV